MKRFLAVFAAAVLLLGGCARAGGDTAEYRKALEDGSGKKQPVTIRYFTWTSASMSAIEPMVEKFNETNGDNITVEVVLQTGEWQNVLKTAIVSGQAPDILHGTLDVVEALGNGWIEPWDAYLSDDFKERIDPYTYKVEVDGRLNTYAFIWGAKTYKMAYNKELFEKAGIRELPQTWEEIYDCAEKITKAGNGEFYGFGLSSCIEGSAVPYIAEPIGAYEGYYKMGYDFRRNTFDFTYLKPYIELFRRMIAEGIAFPGAETLDNDGVRAQFAAGRIGMIPSVSWDCAAINVQYEASCDWDVFEWPAALGGVNRGAMCLRDQANYMLSASCEHKEAAAKFIEFMLGEDFQSEFLAKATDISILPWALEAAKQKPEAEYPQWVKYSPTEDMVQVSNVNLSVQIVGDTEAVTLSKLIANPDMDIDSALAALSKRYNEGLYEQARLDAEKSDGTIAFLGKIMSVENFDPKELILPENIRYLTADEWKALQE